MEVILKMTLIDWLIFWLAIGAYTPLIVGIIKEKNDRSQTFTTWILYFLLDGITMFSTIEKDGNYVILFGFAVGSFIMSFILLYQRRISFTWLEAGTTLMVITSLIVWYLGGPYWTIVAGIVSEAIVGIYLIIRTFRYPVVKYNFAGYFWFLIVSITTMIAATDWSIPQMGYACCETILNIIILIPLLKKWLEDRNTA